MRALPTAFDRADGNSWDGNVFCAAFAEDAGGIPDEVCGKLLDHRQPIDATTACV